MIFAIDIFCFLFGLILLLRIIKQVLNGNTNAYTIFSIVFFVFHFPSLLIDHLIDNGAFVFFDKPVLYKALTDSTVAVVYDISICIILYVLYYQSKKRCNKKFSIIKKIIQNIQFSPVINMFLLFGMIVPLICVQLAPNPYIYTQWAYTYRYNISFLEELYHNNVMANALYLSFFCVVIYAVQKKKYSFIIYNVIVLITWLSFKRTLLVFAVLILIFIDFFKDRFSLRPHKTIFKSIILVFSCIWYFIFYSLNTGKLVDAPFYYSYTLYYSRHYCVKAAILDQLNGMSMLHYRGESILFDLFFYIPREYWPNKPSVFTAYLSNYCQGKSIDSPTTVFYYSNIWTEFIANFHLIGIVIAFLFINFVMNLTEKSKNNYAYVFGVLFIVFYSFWGIQPLTMLIEVIWIICLVIGKFSIKK